MTSTLVKDVEVKNSLGLHTRPATMIAKLMQEYSCEVWLSHKGEKANAKSILSVLMLAATKKSMVTITVQGKEEEASSLMSKLVDAFENRFGEPV